MKLSSASFLNISKWDYSWTRGQGEKEYLLKDTFKHTMSHKAHVLPPIEA